MRRVGGQRHGDEITNAADIQNDLVWAFFEEAAAEESNHRLPVLPPTVAAVNERTEMVDGGRSAACARDRRGRNDRRCHRNEASIGMNDVYTDFGERTSNA